MEIVFRDSNIEEFQLIKDLIKEFSLYVNGQDETNIDEKVMKEILFDKKTAVHKFIEVDGKIAGYISYFLIFSTFKGKHGIYLEDLYVREDFRAMGIGKKAFEFLKDIMRENNYCKIEWNCLNTNSKAMVFYREKLKAEDMNDFTFFTLE